jgi:hypothetical protein
MFGALIFWGALAIICGLAARGRREGAAGFLFVVWGLALLCCFIAPPVVWLFLFSFATFVAVLAAWVLKSRQVALVSLLATLGAGIFFGTSSLRRYREMAALLDKYPAVSVADRLAYETVGRQPERGHAPVSKPAAEVNGDNQLPDPIAGELNRLEERLHDWNTGDGRLFRRPYALARLRSIHDRMVYEFTIAEGFGVGRMFLGGVRSEYIEIPELPTLTVPESAEPTYAETPSTVADARGENAPAGREEVVAPERDELRTVHEAGVVDFANRAGFGFIASRERVVGFQSHGFRNAPQLASTANSSARWRIASLELVSLLKHETPAAYVSGHLPRMDELASAPTRPLDGFEADALRQLRQGEELVVEEQSDELRMLGSLRAAQQCTECHSVQRGDLLGAFTYRLRCEHPVRRRPPPATKPVS